MQASSDDDDTDDTHPHLFHRRAEIEDIVLSIIIFIIIYLFQL